MNTLIGTKIVGSPEGYIMPQTDGSMVLFRLILRTKVNASGHLD
jgi:hypothetical protein